MREHNESLGRPIWSRNWLQIDLLSIFSSTHAVTSLRKTDSCLRGRGKKNFLLRFGGSFNSFIIYCRLLATPLANLPIPFE